MQGDRTMRDRYGGALRRVALAAATLAVSIALGGCSLFGLSRFDVLRAYTTVTNGITAALNGNPSANNPGTSPNSGIAGTYVYTTSDGTAVFSITMVTNSAGITSPTGGSVTFAGYTDSSQVYSISGTLSFTVVPTSGSATNTSPVDLDGNLSLSGGAISTLDCTLNAIGGPSQSTVSQVTIFDFSGTLVANGESYNIADLFE